MKFQADQHHNIIKNIINETIYSRKGVRDISVWARNTDLVIGFASKLHRDSSNKSASGKGRMTYTLLQKQCTEKLSILNQQRHAESNVQRCVIEYYEI